jgi:CobQ-like glutamine amidotransferase family enzyme
MAALRTNSRKSSYRPEKIREIFKRSIEGIPGLFVCGAYQFLGKYYMP